MVDSLRDFLKKKYVRMTCAILALIVIGLAMVWVRTLYGSIQAYKKGETYLKENQFIRAITFFDRSMRWYTPLNPYVEKSAERLWEIGERAERDRDIKLALIAFRTIRGAFIAASHFTTPGKAWIEKSESRITKLVRNEVQERAMGGDSKASKNVISQSQESAHPDIFWSVIVEIGFLGWVGSVIAFIVLRLRPTAESKRFISLITPWVPLAIVFFVLWIVGMIKA
ncbi:MAG: hypothetical protein PVG99_16180 [Desulfobacteraceae bacterium]|jgi:hypothetical protein